jgi:hypothetical protein
MRGAHRLLGVAVCSLLSACAHQTGWPTGSRDDDPIRTGALRFDERSMTSPHVSFTRTSDGSWVGLDGERYERDGDTLRVVAAGKTDLNQAIIRSTGYVRIERLPNGLVYTPSYATGPVWTFVTEDGKPLPEDLEIPLYLAARIDLRAVGYKSPNGCVTSILKVQDRNVAARWWRPVEGPDPCALVVFPEGAAERTGQVSETLVQSYRPLP